MTAAAVVQPDSCIAAWLANSTLHCRCPVGRALVPVRRIVCGRKSGRRTGRCPGGPVRIPFGWMQPAACRPTTRGQPRGQRVYGGDDPSDDPSARRDGPSDAWARKRDARDSCSDGAGDDGRVCHPWSQCCSSASCGDRSARAYLLSSLCSYLVCFRRAQARIRRQGRSAERRTATVATYCRFCVTDKSQSSFSIGWWCVGEDAGEDDGFLVELACCFGLSTAINGIRYDSMHHYYYLLLSTPAAFWRLPCFSQRLNRSAIS